MYKNIARGLEGGSMVKEDYFVLKHYNSTDKVSRIERAVDSSYIQFHFCLEGKGVLVFNEGRYTFPVNNNHSVLLYNPQQQLPLNLELQSESKMISILFSIKKFHSLFSNESDFIHFIREENRDRKFYSDKEIDPSVGVVLHQLYQNNIHSSLKNLYSKGKVYELLSLYFNRAEGNAVQNCPFLENEENVQKIKLAKEIIIGRMSEPPTLADLASEIGLSLSKLKEGFKEIYGDTVYGFLFDYKMETARKLLESDTMNVNEVGLKIGYSTASHFIAAFKKKYGTTPKKYLKASN